MLTGSTLTYLAIAGIAYLLYKRGVIPNMLPTPATPIDAAKDVAAIIDALLARLLPAFQQIVRSEVATRGPVIDVAKHTVEANPDGSLLIRPPVAVTKS